MSISRQKAAVARSLGTRAGLLGVGLRPAIRTTPQRWYVLVDPDTDVEYLVNDRGGCCPRLSPNGTVIGVTGDE